MIFAHGFGCDRTTCTYGNTLTSSGSEASNNPYRYEGGYIDLALRGSVPFSARQTR